MWRQGWSTASISVVTIERAGAPGKPAPELRPGLAEPLRQEHDPSQILGERNLFRYRPVRGILVRVEASTSRVPLVQIVLAALTREAPLTVSLSPDRDDWDWLADLSPVQVVVEDEASLFARLSAGDAVYDRLRALGPLSTALRRPSTQ